MTIKELKEIIENEPDERIVLISMDGAIDDVFDCGHTIDRDTGEDKDFYLES